MSEIEVKKISLKFENRIIYKCRMWLSVVRWLRKTIFEPTKKSIFKIEIFWSDIEVKKFLWNWKIEFATNAEYDSAWPPDHEKLYLSPSKNQFLRTKLFGHKLRWKKLPWNRKIQLATNAEYDTAWSADREKLYLSISKNQFL